MIRVALFLTLTLWLANCAPKEDKMTVIPVRITLFRATQLAITLVFTQDISI